MPTENERKYVLRVESEDSFKEAADTVLICKQAYLAFSKGMSARVRETIEHKCQAVGNVKRHVTVGSSKYRFTFKQKVNGRVVEIEKKIDQRDFDDLWSVALNRLEKFRYNLWVNEEEGFGHPDLVLWEVDFFKDRDHHTYFALAEHEMPEGQLEPNIMPLIIEQNLIYTPELDDSNFSSKRLADVRFATLKYKELLEQWVSSD